MPTKAFPIHSFKAATQGVVCVIIMSALQYFHCVFGYMTQLEGTGASPINTHAQ